MSWALIISDANQTQGTPKVALQSETGLLSMKMRIWKRKCMLIHHIKNMEEEALAKKVYSEQRENERDLLCKKGNKT